MIAAADNIMFSICSINYYTINFFPTPHPYYCVPQGLYNIIKNTSGPKTRCTRKNSDGFINPRNTPVVYTYLKRVWPCGRMKKSLVCQNGNFNNVRLPGIFLTLTHPRCTRVGIRYKYICTHIVRTRICCAPRARVYCLLRTVCTHMYVYTIWAYR